MSEVRFFKPNESFNSIITTGNANFSSVTTADSVNAEYPAIVSVIPESYKIVDAGKYSIFEIADWFLAKSEMTHKKLQKLCYYAQAWCYALRGYRLADTDFQAWIHGPVSPALYERFKGFGYDSIRIVGDYVSQIEEADVQLLEDVWETYGDHTGNALEVLTHREFPWQEARKGYAPDERCTVVISPESMISYYKSIYAGN